MPSASHATAASSNTGTATLPVAALIEHFKDTAGSQIHDLKRDGVETQILLHPAGLTAVEVSRFVDPLLPRPRRKTGTITLKSACCFNTFVAAHKEPSSVVFADPKTGAVTAVLNFHDTAADGQRWGDLRAKYDPVFSKEWQAWTAVHGKTLDTATFAAFIDDHISDILPPPATDETGEAVESLRGFARDYRTAYADRDQLIALSRGLRVHVADQVEQVVNTNSGELSLQFRNEHKTIDGKPLEVPGLFCIGIPVFDRGVNYRLPARLKYRVKDGAILWSVELITRDNALEHAVDEVVAGVRAATGLMTLFGDAPSHQR